MTKGKMDLKKESISVKTNMLRKVPCTTVKQATFLGQFS